MNFKNSIQTKKDPFSEDLGKEEELNILKQIEKYDWFHTILVANGISTKGKHDNREFTLNQFKMIDFHGAKVLDVGCADGFYSFEAEKRGAKKILSIDKKISKGMTEFLIPHFNSIVETREVDLFEFKSKEKFDIIIFAGILYHVADPFLAMNTVKELLKKGGFLIVETALYLDENKKALLHCPSIEDNPYKKPWRNTFFNHKGLIDNFKDLKMEIINIYPDERMTKSRNIVRDSFLFRKI